MTIVPTVTPNSPDASHVFDLAIKYGALVAAVTYLLGMIWQVSFLPDSVSATISDFPLNNAKYFVFGVTPVLEMVMACLMPLWFEASYFGLRALLRFIAERIFAHYALSIWLRRLVFPKFTRSAFVGAGLLAFCLTESSMFRSNLHASWHDVIRGDVSSILAAGTLLFIFYFPEVFRRIGPLRQSGVAFVLIVSLVGFTMIKARLTWATTSGAKCHTVRLLISPDGVNGARKLGIDVGSSREEKAPQLSEELCIIYEGEHSYALRLKNGIVVQINKDQVWGVAP